MQSKKVTRQELYNYTHNQIIASYMNVSEDLKKTLFIESWTDSNGIYNSELVLTKIDKKVRSEVYRGNNLELALSHYNSI